MILVEATAFRRNDGGEAGVGGRCDECFRVGCRCGGTHGDGHRLRLTRQQAHAERDDVVPRIGAGAESARGGRFGGDEVVSGRQLDLADDLRLACGHPEPAVGRDVGGQ